MNPMFDDERQHKRLIATQCVVIAAEMLQKIASAPTAASVAEHFGPDEGLDQNGRHTAACAEVMFAFFDRIKPEVQAIRTQCAEIVGPPTDEEMTEYSAPSIEDILDKLDEYDENAA